MRISPPNAAYKVNSLVKKGYVRKVQSPDDRREYHLEVTQKYIDYYNISSSYMAEVMERIAGALSGGGLRQAGGDSHCGQPGADAGDHAAPPGGGRAGGALMSGTEEPCS